VPPHELKLLPDNIKGHGGFGIVMAGQFQGTPVAAKIIKTPFDAHRAIVSLCNEVRILRKLRHPHIVSLYGVSVDLVYGEVAIILENVDGAPLNEFINLWNVRCSSQLLKLGHDLSQCYMKVAGEIACAIRYLHSRQPQIIHGDLKDSNIFITSPSDCIWLTASA